MTSSASKTPFETLASAVAVTDEFLSVELNDGRTLCVPLAWYPRLQHGSTAERKLWHLTGKGLGIHWPLLDEDISIAGLLAGNPSGESHISFRRWLDTRSAPTRS
jgi:hypothetical protein